MSFLFSSSFLLLFADGRKIKGMNIKSIQTVSQRSAPKENTEQEMDGANTSTTAQRSAM